MKLDLDSIKPVSRGGKPIKQKNAPGKRVIRLIRLSMVLALVGLSVAVAYLMWQVPERPGKAEDEVAIGQKRFDALERLVQGKKAGTMEIQVTELNNYLGTLHAEDANIKWGFMPEQIWAEIRPNEVTFHLLLTMRMGELFSRKLCLSWTGLPEVKDGTIQFVTSSAKVGELTWPNPMVNAIGLHARLFGQIADKLSSERDVLSRLSRLDVQSNCVVVAFEPH